MINSVASALQSLVLVLTQPQLHDAQHTITTALAGVVCLLVHHNSSNSGSSNSSGTSSSSCSLS
jgi:hypothetical protein